MFWPLILPLQITLGMLFGIIAAATLVTALSPRWKWPHLKGFIVSLIFAFIVFVPSCVAIISVVDSLRFGEFHHAQFADVKDFRVERFLPKSARDITLHKYSQGYYARYTITESELAAYLNWRWDDYAKHFSVPRHDLEKMRSEAEKPLLDFEFEFTRSFGDLGWSVPADGLKLQSPVAANGSGATYFLDRKTGIAYQVANYW